MCTVVLFNISCWLQTEQDVDNSRDDKLRRLVLWPKMSFSLVSAGEQSIVPKGLSVVDQ